MRAKTKLRSRRGFTLTEMIVTVLILTLVAAGMTVGISSALRVYHQSVTYSDAETLTSTLSTALMDELRYARSISGEETPTFTSLNYGVGVSVGTNADGHVTVGGKMLVGSGAYAGLTANANVTYKGGLFQVVLTISSGDEAVRTTKFSVQLLNH